MWGITIGSQRMKDYSDVAIGMNYGVIFVLPKHTLGELEGPCRLLPPFKGGHLEHAQISWLAPIFPRSTWLVENIWLTSTLWLDGPLGVGCTRSQVLGKLSI